MSQPFDFATTPITDTTTLVARYRKTGGGGLLLVAIGLG